MVKWVENLPSSAFLGGAHQRDQRTSKGDQVGRWERVRDDPCSTFLVECQCTNRIRTPDNSTTFKHCPENFDLNEKLARRKYFWQGVHSSVNPEKQMGRNLQV